MGSLDFINTFMSSRSLGPFTDTDKIKNSGLDSLLYVELVVELEKKYNIRFGPEMILVTSFDDYGSLSKYTDSLRTCELAIK